MRQRKEKELTTKQHHPTTSIRWMCIPRCLVLKEHLYLSGEWLGVDLRTDTKTTCVEKMIGLCAQTLSTIRDTIVT